MLQFSIVYPSVWYQKFCWKYLGLLKFFRFTRKAKILVSFLREVTWFAFVSSIVCSRQSAFFSIAEYVGKSGASCCGNGSSTTCCSVCIRRWRRLFISSSSRTVLIWADFHNKPNHDVTTAKYTPQTTTWRVRPLNYRKCLFRVFITLQLYVIYLYTLHAVVSTYSLVGGSSFMNCHGLIWHQAYNGEIAVNQCQWSVRC